MIETLKKILVKSVRQMNIFFKDSRKDIAKNNILLLISISFSLLILVCALLIATPFIIPTWKISIGHWLFFPLFLIYTLFGRYLYKEHREEYHIVHLTVISFLMILMILIIYINTVPYPDSTATLVTSAMIVLPVLFILPFYEMVILLFGVFLVFLQMNALYIQPEFVRYNIFNGVVGLLCGITVAWIVTNIRAEDNKNKQELLRKSSQDKLTGIANKSEVEKNCLEYLEISNTESCVLIVIDIDYFKGINDSMGHHAGDQVLRIFGQSMQKVFRESDIFGRIGGDEFLVLMKKVENAELVEIKMQTLSAMFYQNVFETLNIKVTCSYGAIIKDEEFISYVHLFNMADKILYRAKKNGKNQGEVFTIAQYHQLMKRKKIMLVVDDSEVNRRLISKIFAQDYEIVEAGDGIEAIETIQKHCNLVSIMMLDIMMPKMDGFQVLDWIREHGYSNLFPVIAISSDEGKELQSLELGVADMISKPFVPDVMKKRVENVMRGI